MAKILLKLENLNLNLDNINSNILENYYKISFIKLQF